MSATAAWSYTNTATIRPYLGRDEWGAASYGQEYTIACTWAAVELQERNAGGAGGAEMVLKHEVYTEDERPKYLDMINLNGSAEWEEIRQRTAYDMSFFGEVPDYKLVTG